MSDDSVVAVEDKDKDKAEEVPDDFISDPVDPAEPAVEESAEESTDG